MTAASEDRAGLRGRSTGGHSRFTATAAAAPGSAQSDACARARHEERQKTRAARERYLQAESQLWWICAGTGCSPAVGRMRCSSGSRGHSRASASRKNEPLRHITHCRDSQAGGSRVSQPARALAMRHDSAVQPKPRIPAQGKCRRTGAEVVAGRAGAGEDREACWSAHRKHPACLWHFRLRRFPGSRL